MNFHIQKSSELLTKSIESLSYSEDDLIEIKIPLNNPYISDHEFKLVQGETKYKGKFYQYVKRKIADNILHLLCLPNIKKENLIQTKNNLAENNSTNIDNKNSNKNNSNKITHISLLEFIQPLSFNGFEIQIPIASILHNTNHLCDKTQNKPYTSFQPPKNLI
jgi:hypothetical protein